MFPVRGLKGCNTPVYTQGLECLCWWFLWGFTGFVSYKSKDPITP